MTHQNKKNRDQLNNPLSMAWSFEEDEFLAENERISIIPDFSLPKLQFIQEQYGPFRPKIAVEVPLWLAITLKLTKKCRIQIPEWLTEPWLNEILSCERSDQMFAELPFYAFEIVKLLLRYASDDFKFCGINERKVRVLLNDIRDQRRSKIRTGYKNLEIDTMQVQLNNISANELNTSRHYLLSYLDICSELTKVKEEDMKEDGDMDQDEYDEDQEIPESDGSQNEDDETMTMKGNVIEYTSETQYTEPLRKLRRLQQ
eukprot:450018_1